MFVIGSLFSLSRTVFKIYDFKVFPWFHLNLWHLEDTGGLTFFLLFEIPCMVSYILTIDTLSLSHIVFFGFFNLKKSSVWHPWHLFWPLEVTARIFRQTFLKFVDFVFGFFIYNNFSKLAISFHFELTAWPKTPNLRHKNNFPVQL